MFGMKDDGMRGMRLKAKSKYLDDLLADNDGKMAVEIKKVYMPGKKAAMPGMEAEEEIGTSENEMPEEGLPPELAKVVQGAGDVAEKAAMKAGALQGEMESEEELSPEEIMKLMKKLNISL